MPQTIPSQLYYPSSSSRFHLKRGTSSKLTGAQPSPVSLYLYFKYATNYFSPTLLPSQFFAFHLERGTSSKLTGARSRPVNFFFLSSVGVDKCGRGAPFGMKLGRTGSCNRVLGESVCGMYISAIRLATLFPSGNHHLPWNATRYSWLTHRYQFILLGEQGWVWIEERWPKYFLPGVGIETPTSHLAGECWTTQLPRSTNNFHSSIVKWGIKQET